MLDAFIPRSGIAQAECRAGGFTVRFGQHKRKRTAALSVQAAVLH